MDFSSGSRYSCIKLHSAITRLGVVEDARYFTFVYTWQILALLNHNFLTKYTIVDFVRK